MAAMPILVLPVTAKLCEKKKEPCAESIHKCPDDGCSGDGELNEAKKEFNRHKNMPPTELGTPTLRTIEWMRNRPNPQDCWDRRELQKLHEGDLVTVIAWALAA